MLTIIGLMSGTAFDAIDIALIETDGRNYVNHVAFQSYDYPDHIIKTYKKILGLCKKGIPAQSLLEFERDLTILHAEVVNHFLKEVKVPNQKVDFIGFHGQTIYHNPTEHVTLLVGDGGLLAKETGIDVFCNFRTIDVAYGGQGAPILPVYHQALFSTLLPKPFAVLNIGGVSNITYIDGNDDHQDDAGIGLIAFDTGPGNALIDDVMFTNTNNRFDQDGKIAEHNTVIVHALHALLQEKYLSLPYPKSIDRNYWKEKVLKKLDNFPYKDQVSTLTEFTVASIVKGIELLPKKPKTLVVCGGGRHNKYIIQRLKQEAKGIAVKVAEEVKLQTGQSINGSAIEAEGMAYLAARSHLKLPITFPGTTGVSKPVGGGAFYRSWS